MSQSGQKTKKNENIKVDSFIWPDDEVELLLNDMNSLKPSLTVHTFCNTRNTCTGTAGLLWKWGGGEGGAENIFSQ